MAAIAAECADRLKAVLEEARDLGSDSEELGVRAWDWASRLALDPARANLLRALDLEPGLRAAEIGCGAGTIARRLGETCASVVALEPDARLAALARLRCRDLDAVRVLEASDLSALAEHGPFDLIVMADGRERFGGALNEAAALLRPGGALVAAAPNRFAVERYSGAGDGERGALFQGVEGSAEGGAAGRAEFLRGLAAAGFEGIQLFLPFPDHRLPVAFLNAEYADAEDAARWGLLEWCRHPFGGQGGERARLFHDHLALDAFARAGLLADHASGFLATAAAPGDGPPALRRSRWIARKYNLHRRRAYRTESTLTEAGLVRRPLEGGAAPAEDAPILQRLASPPYLRGARSLSWDMVRALRPRFDAAAFSAALGRWIAFLRGAADGGGALDGRYMDCTPGKLFKREDGSLAFVDDEWRWKAPVPIDWVVFRGLLGFWLSEKRWIDAALFSAPYSFHDYLDACLAPVGATIAADRLAALTALERRFQSAAVAAPGVDYDHLLSNVYAPEETRVLGPREMRDRREADKRAAHARIEIETVRSLESSLRREVGKRESRLAEGAAEYERRLRDETAELERELARRDAAERERRLAEEKRRRVADRVDRRLAESLAAARGALLKERPADEPPPPCRRAYDILIPIYDAYDHVRRCVESVLRHTEPRHAVYLLDDASPDARILPLLEEFAKTEARVKVLPSERNGGFVRNVNRGFRLSRRSVVILNSDTEVTPYWLERLDRCRESGPEVGVVSPLSNNATVLSVPEMNADNALPEGMTPRDMAEVVARVSKRAYPRLPTAVGFCMLITRAALDRCGEFDEVFGLGYGEECDFCMRAWAEGMEVVCCDDAYVHHYGEASFRAVDGIDERRRRNAETLDRRWPSYHSTVFAFCHLNPMREIQERIGAVLRRREGETRSHVLHVMHSFGALGGTELHTQQMIDGLSADFRATVLYPHPQPDLWTDMVSGRPRDGLRLVRFSKENATSVESFLGVAGDLSNRTVEGNFARFLAGSDCDIVHFQHLAAWSSLTLPFIAKALGRRVVLSLHDYFLLCPDYNLVRPDGRRCGKSKADAADEDCFRCLGEKRRSLEKTAPIPLHEYLEDRTELVARALAAADALVAPSEFVRAQFARAHGEAVGARIRVIPHGLPALEPSPRPKRGGMLRVGFLGNLTERKGAMTLLEAARRLRGKPVRFEVFGGVDPALQAVALKAGLKLRGPYRPADLPGLLSRIDLVLIPSVWDETFCLTLGEARAMGVPVLASAAGAMAERIVDGENGFLTPPSDSAALAARLLDLARRPDSLAGVIEGLRAHRPKTLDENAADYARLYEELLGPSDGGARLVRALLGVQDRIAA